MACLRRGLHWHRLRCLCCATAHAWHNTFYWRSKRPNTKANYMAKHKRTSTHVLHAAAQVVAARQGKTQWPSATVAKFNARYTYGITQGTVQRLHCKAQQAPPIVATVPVPVKAYWPAHTKASKRYAVSGTGLTKAQKARVKLATAPVHINAGACTVGYKAVIAGQQWHYCLRTSTYSCKALGVSYTARQVRRNFGQAMATQILALGK